MSEKIKGTTSLYGYLNKELDRRLDMIKEILDINFSEEDYDIEIIKEREESYYSNYLAIVMKNDTPKYVVGEKLYVEDDLEKGSYTVLGDLDKVNNIFIEEFIKENSSYLREIVNTFLRNTFLNITLRHNDITISNEDGKSHYIGTIYTKFKCSGYGRLIRGFDIGRNEFLIEEARCGYIHSHISSGNFCNGIVEWGDPCLGGGPIRTTANNLDYYDIDVLKDSDYGLFMMYINDITEFVGIESLAGVPYMSLEQLQNYRGSNNRNEGGYFTVDDKFYFLNPNFNQMFENLSRFRTMFNINEIGTTEYIHNHTLLKEFTKHFLSDNDLKFKIVDDVVSPAYSYKEFIFKVTKVFKEYVNMSILSGESNIEIKNLFKKGLLYPYIEENNKLSISTEHRAGNEVNNREFRNDFLENIGKETRLTFKGEPLKFNVILPKTDKVEDDNFNKSILSPIFINYIYNIIIFILNKN